MLAVGEAVQQPRPVGRLGDRLGGDRADPGARPRRRSARRRTSATERRPRAPRWQRRGRRSNRYRGACLRIYPSPCAARPISRPTAPAPCSPALARCRAGTSPPTPTSTRPRRASPGTVLSACDDPAVPWHRIVRSDGSLTQGERQAALLDAEGVALTGDPRRVDVRMARWWSDVDPA